MAILVLVLACVSTNAQMMDPVHFTTQLKELKNGEAELIFKATIDAGWHVYSTGLGNDGPISASFNKVKMDGAETVGKLQARGNEIKQFDKLFDMEVRYFEKAVTFVQKIKFTKPKYAIDCYVEYGVCNDQSCLPPSEAAFKQSGNSPIKEETVDVKAEPIVDTAKVEAPVDSAVVDTMVVADNLWTPVVAELQSMNGESAPTESMALWLIFLKSL